MKKIMKKIFLGVGILLLCFVAFVGYLLLTDKKDEPKVLQHRPIKIEMYSDIPDGKVITEFKGWKRGIQVNDLDEKLKNYASEIMNIVKNEKGDPNEKTIEMDINANEEAKLLEAIDNTYYMPNIIEDMGEYVGNNKLEIRKVKDHEYSIHIGNSLFALEDVNAFKKKAESIVNDVVKIGMTEKEAVLQLNNAICDLVETDKDRTDGYGGLLTGKGLSGEYAIAFQYLCEYVGINSEIVLGEVKINNKVYTHRWNKVKFDGQDEYYYIDVFANDENDNKYTLTAKLWDDHFLSFLNE